MTNTVATIFADVESRGAAAVREWAVRLDGAEPRAFEITPAAVAEARAKVTAQDVEALELAAANIRSFHEADRPVDGEAVVTTPGVRCRRVWRPIRTAGLYVPGGTAPLFSTLLMLAIPAAVAGVPQRVAVTPPSKEGPHPMMVLAAAACGLEVLHLVGGAQAVAALTYGAGLPKAHKILGPGNAYVAEAKRQAAALDGGPSIDMPAGPSELLVLADGSADATVVAADLLSQAEHDRDAQVVVVSPDAAFLDAVEAEVARLLERLPRADIARASLTSGVAVLCGDVEQGLEIANAYAPEHLSLQVARAERLIGDVTNAGTVFVGPFAAETFGDYVSGPSHVLPTDGAARTYSGVTTASFMKSLAVQEVTSEGAQALAGAAARLARWEGLEAHALAADLRGQRVRGAA